MAFEIVPFVRPNTGPTLNDPNNPLKREMNRRLVAARRDRDRHLPDMRDVYRYSMPWRHLADQTQPPNRALNGLYDETAMYVLEDFAGDMLNVFTPRKNNWIEFTPNQMLNQVQQAQIKDMVRGLQLFLFDRMGESNLYQALQEAYCDLGVGTMALLILDLNPAQPVHCESIPGPDLLLNRGPYGRVDGIYRNKRYFREEAEILWPDADWSILGTAPETYADAGLAYIEISDGCWRDWSDRGNETYQYGVMANGNFVFHRTYRGAGACPFIVARWSRDSTTAWGFGPTYRTLPAIRTLNYARFLDIKNYEKYVDPPTSYEDDGVLNVDQGIEPGDWIPRAVGSEEPKVIESMARFDVAAMERDELRSTVRRAHYQDRPDQLGKTPPTATQWSDEAAERARRMGTPATNLVEELQYPIVRRFSRIFADRGTLPKVEIQNQAVSMEPSSALLRAQQQEEVVRMDKFAELIAARFGPQMAIVVIDVVKYAQKMGKLLDIDENVMRNEDKIAQAIQQLMPVLQQVSGGATGQPVAPPPVG